MANANKKAPTEEVKQWRGRLAVAKFYRKKVGDTEGRWARYARALAGDFTKGKPYDDENRLDVNMVHGTTQVALSPLYTTDPHFTVTPLRRTITIGGKTVNNIERARYTEAELNYWFIEKKVRTKAIRPVTYDIETTNHGYLYLGYITKDQRNLVENDDGTKRHEPNPLIKVDEPFIIRLSPRQVFVPPGTIDFDSMPWVAIEWTMTADAVKQRWDKEVEPTKSILDKQQFDPKGTDNELDVYLESADAKLVQLYQFWRQEDRKLITMADGHPELLEKAEWPDQTEGLPLVHGQFVDVPDEYWGSPPMQMYFAQQLELNAARTASKRRNNKLKNVVFVKSGIDPGLKDAYANAPDGAMIEVKCDDDVKLSDMLVVDKGLPAPNEAYAEGQIQMNDIFVIRGTGFTQRGFGDPSIGSATESANVEKWAIIRSIDSGDRIRSMYLDAASKLHMILRQHPNVKRERLIKGEFGRRVTALNYTLRELEGEFAFTMDLGTMLAENPQLREQRATSNYNLLRNDPRVKPEALILDLLDAQGKADPASYLLELRQPGEEFQMMIQGLPVEPHERDDHLTHQAEHEIQLQQLSRALDGVPDPASRDGERVRTAMLLMLAHMNAHGKFIQELTGERGAPGTPIDRNQLRNTLAAQPAGPETAAELGGQPVGTGEASAPRV